MTSRRAAGRHGYVLASVRPLFVAAALASGAAIYAAEPAKRIAALAPSITELVYAAGAGKSLVAVSAFSDYPEAARQLPQVADFAGINLEALIRLKPDLVLVWESGTRQADIARLRSLQIRTESIRIDTFDDVPKAIRRLGEFAGTTETAYAAAEKFVLRAKELADKNRGKPKVSVFFEIGRSPLLTINGHHFITQVLSICGGVNVFASASQQVFQPSHETLLQIDPQVVMRGASPHGNRDRDDGLYQGFAAYRRGQILSVNADHILRPGPRLIDAAADVCDVLDGVRAAK
ncbi:MAG: cobalamin-binding protein [Rhodocyclaceae bacterium]|nr:cobalamin-binding protein [Rhodocyclaceae bacterium]MCA3081583.1 cobalamin-binding protein [Rhodocyclaceae bacterium]